MRRGRGLIGPLFASLLVAFVARRVLDVVEVRGSSMLPTLRAGDRLVVIRLHRPPRPGEIVLAADPREGRREVVKRVARVDVDGVDLRGDNVAASTDGRVFGRVPTRVVRWRVALRCWPLDRLGRPPGPAAASEVLDGGGEPACAVPGALVTDPGPHPSA
jgi:nickel-type superoxide dismutase maturation protease